MFKRFLSIVALIGAGVLAADARQPNIIFILVDDLGKEWVNCYGGEGIETPRIDELAKSGMKLTNAYSMPQCTPSRTCFMTGQYPFRNGWVNHWDVPRWGVGYYDWKKNPSVARIMKSAGYKTAAAGKWQINDFRLEPEAMVKHGFDEYCMWTGAETGVKASENRYWDPYIHTRDGSRTYKGAFGPDIYNQFLLDFISKNKDNPFFIYYPMTLTHDPLVHTPSEMDVKDKLDKHKAMVRYTDFLVGKIYDHLESLGIRDNTIFIWTTDNGTSGSLSNNKDGRTVKGGKSKTTENGVNAPFIVSCPGTVPSGVVCDELVDFTDMLPTFADFASAKLPKEYTFDGYSMQALFTGKSETSPRKWIMAMGGGGGTATEKGIENKFYWRDRVIREKRFKLFLAPDKSIEKLVDIQADPEEQNDLSRNPEYAGVVTRLKKVANSFPQFDNDPIYEPRAANDWNKAGKSPSQIHKTGHPDNTNAPRKAKKTKKQKEQLK